jgi:hypothetical protein
MTKSRGVGRGFGGGRPTSYKPEFANQVTGICLLGAKDSHLAHIFGVNEDTINEWKRVYPKFSASIKKGKLDANIYVAKSLYRDAKAGNTTAQIFWLKNRCPEFWRDAQEHRHSGTITLAALVCGEDEPAKLKAKPIKQIEASLEEE